MLHAFRLGTEVLWAALLEEARTHAPHMLDDLLDSAAQVMELIDVMSVAVADEYRAREMVILRRDAERRQAVLDSLLEGRGADPDVAAEAVGVLNLPERPRLVVVVVGHSTPSASPPVSPRRHWRRTGSDQSGGCAQTGRSVSSCSEPHPWSD